MARASPGPALVTHWRSSCGISDAVWEQWGGLCLCSALTALVHGAGVGTHGLEVVIFPIPWYQMIPKYILMYDLLPVFERHLCFQKAGCSCGLSVTCPSTPSQLTYRWVWNLSACNLKSFMFVGRISLCKDMKNSLPLFYCFTSHQVVDCILQAWSSFHPKYQAGGKVTGRTHTPCIFPTNTLLK